MPNEAGRSDSIWLDKEFAKKCGVSVRTLARWRGVGVVSKATGKRVKLRARQRGGRWFTSDEWYDNFIDRLNGDLK